MTWSWRYESGDGAPVDPGERGAQQFPTQADAESWIGETWRSLLESGVDQVVLLEDERAVYGPMSLHPPE